MDFRVADYSWVLRNALDDSERYRALMHDLPRPFHQLQPALQARALRDPAPLAGTDWDALLAAVVEHVARLHGHPVPAWAEEAERFLDPPWVISACPETARESVLFAPAAFVRHGAFPDLASLDARGASVTLGRPAGKAMAGPIPPRQINAQLPPIAMVEDGGRGGARLLDREGLVRALDGLSERLRQRGLSARFTSLAAPR